MRIKTPPDKFPSGPLERFNESVVVVIASEAKQSRANFCTHVIDRHGGQRAA